MVKSSPISFNDHYLRILIEILKPFAAEIVGYFTQNSAGNFLFFPAKNVPIGLLTMKKSGAKHVYRINGEQLGLVGHSYLNFLKTIINKLAIAFQSEIAHLCVTQEIDLINEAS